MHMCKLLLTATFYFPILLAEGSAEADACAVQRCSGFGLKVRQRCSGFRECSAVGAGFGKCILVEFLSVSMASN